MKILQINNVYGFGSTGKITQQLHKELLARGFESVVYYGRRFKSQDAGVHRLFGDVYGKLQNGISRITGLMYGGCLLSTQAFIRAIEKEKPDVVHLQCLNGYFVNIYKLIAYLKKSGIPTVLTLHAEFMHTANCGYAYDCEKWKTGCGQCPTLKKTTNSLIFDRTAESWKRMKAAFDGFEKLTIISVSEWLMDRAKQSPILADFDHQVIYNGLDTSLFRSYSTEECSKLREELGIAKDKKVILHVTPAFNLDPNHIKGGYYVQQLAERTPEAAFVVAGAYDPACAMPENVVMLGEIRDQRKLALLYSMADITLLTSRKETFSMVCAESLCCGTPVVGFKAGAPERISLKEYSAFCEHGDVEQLVATVTAANRSEEKVKISTAAHDAYSRETMAKKYIHVYSEYTADR